MDLHFSSVKLRVRKFCDVLVSDVAQGEGVRYYGAVEILHGLIGCIPGAAPPMIVYRDHVRGLSPAQLEGFFQGWPSKPSAQTLLAILEGSTFVEVAFDTELDRVVGFANAISDGVLSAYIPLLEVLPEHRRRGIGAALIERLLHRMEHLYMIDLVCDEPMVPFYQRLGLHRLQGMAWRNFHHQDGEAGMLRLRRAAEGGEPE